MRHFLSIDDLSPDEARYLLAEAARLKCEPKEHAERQSRMLKGQALALIFEKPSLRTRMSFDVGMYQLGGHAVYLAPSEIGLGSREPVADVARTVGAMCQGIVARVFAHATVAELARHAGVPVVNGLCDREHPCQAMADLLTVRECRGLERQKFCYLGDGNNVCHSLMLLCAKLGVAFTAATPPGYEPHPEVVERARQDGEVTLTHDAREAAQGADVLYTDVWTSMGQEEEAHQRLGAFPAFQLNAALLAVAKPDAIVLHCLPAHRGEEISAEVLEGPHARVWMQAENRLHAQKAVLAWLLS